MKTFYFISLLLLFILVLGMCIPNFSEAFTVTDFGDMDYYDWGLRKPYNDKHFDKKHHHKHHKHHKHRHPKYHPPGYNYPQREGEYKCYYEPSQRENNYCQNAMKRCPLNIHPDLNNYIPKSMIPPQPNLNNYILKSNIPPAQCPDPQKCPPHPDMKTFKKFMKKEGKCPTCPQFLNNLLPKPSNKLQKETKKKNNRVKPSAGYEYV